MKQNWKMTFGVVCALCLSGAVYGQNQNLPNGKGKAELISGCTDCHSTDMIIQKRRTAEDWKKVVNDMASRGSDATPKDIDSIVRYLSTNFGIKKAGTTAATKSETPSAPAPAKR